MPLRAAVNQHPLFEGLENHYLYGLHGCASDASFAGGSTIFEYGEPANHFYLIGEGRISLDIAVPGRGIIPVQTLQSGDVVGWSWLYPPYQWHFSGRALEETTAIVFDADCVRQLIAQDHEFGFEMMVRFSKIVIERLQAARIQLLDMYAVAA